MIAAHNARNLHGILLGTFLLLTQTACTSFQHFSYFTSGPDFQNLPDSTIHAAPLLIQAGDVLCVTLSGIGENDWKAHPFAPMSISEKSECSSGEYRVSSDGTLHIAGLKPIAAARKTVEKLEKEIESLLQEYFVEPIARVQLRNWSTTIIGEVAKPGLYTFEKEKITVLEALAKAGDITKYGDKRQVLLIREEQGKRKFYYLNLQDKSLFNAPVFYLQQNDLLYVKPLPSIVFSVADGSTKIIPWIGLGSTLLNILLYLLR